jgi:hypothetical protein
MTFSERAGIVKWGRAGPLGTVADFRYRDGVSGPVCFREHWSVVKRKRHPVRRAQCRMLIWLFA